MAAVASEIFDFLDVHPVFETERHEISLPGFGKLRRSLRPIIVNLSEGGDHEAVEAADRLRGLLSEWLTVPVPFDGAIVAALEKYGEPATIEARWGLDIRHAFDSALGAARDLPNVENPVRSILQTEIRALRLSGRKFKIYCHRTARPHFESLFILPDDVPLKEGNFMHSVREYRESETFDTLIKVGPLRSWGWGSAPDAIISAPRFGTLLQIVWAGCSDEPGFGYDPVAASPLITALPGTLAVDGGALGNRISWTPCITRLGQEADATEDTTEDDDFKIFGCLNQMGSRRRATLIQIDALHGILYPTHSQVLSFDPALHSTAPLWKRLPGETLHENMFVIRPLLGEVDFGAQKAGHGSYSQLWKARLNEERRNDLEGLLRRLQAAGLHLVCLATDVRNWCVAPTTVIHAPHKRSHFEILIRVLEISAEGSEKPTQHHAPWWQRAWNEIRSSRGDAIQAGLQGQEIVEDQLMSMLNNLLPRIEQMARKSDGFALELLNDQAIQGAALFNKVIRIEEGFLVPDSELKVVRDLNTVQQWRA